MVKAIICGTPGTGKSTIVDRLKSKLSKDEFKFINLSQFAIEEACTLEYDEDLQSHMIDEDKLSDMIQPLLDKSDNIIVESIHADLVPLKQIDLIFVCRTDNTKLYDRLKARGYSENKISENVQAEIFQTILDEARSNLEDGNGNAKIIELSNNELEDVDTNVQLVVDEIVSKAEK